MRKRICMCIYGQGEKQGEREIERTTMYKWGRGQSLQGLGSGSIPPTPSSHPSVTGVPGWWGAVWCNAWIRLQNSIDIDGDR